MLSRRAATGLLLSLGGLTPSQRSLANFRRLPDRQCYMVASNRLAINQAHYKVPSGSQYFLSVQKPSTGNWNAKYGRFLLSNTYSSAGIITNGRNTINIEKMALWISGALACPITIRGCRSYALGSGESVWTDPLPVIVAANTQMEVRIAGNTAVGDYVVGGGYLVNMAAGETFLSAGTTQAGKVDFTSPFVGDGSIGGPFCFNAFVAQGWDGSCVGLLLGDSIAWGNHANQMLADARGNYSYVTLGLDSPKGGRVPLFNTAMWSSTMISVTSTLNWVKAVCDLLSNLPFNAVFNELGINDTNAGFGGMQASENSLISFVQNNFPRCRYYNFTLTPESKQLSNSFWTDEINQTWSTSGVGPDPSARSRFNQWRRELPPGVNGCLDAASAVCGTDTAKWKSSGLGGSAAAIFTNISNICSLDTAPPIGSYLIFEPRDEKNADGLNGAYGYQVSSVSGHGPYIVTVLRDQSWTANKILKPHAPGIQVLFGLVADGVHPGTYAHTLLSDALISEKSKIVC